MNLEDNYIEQNKPDTGRKKQHDHTYLQNLKKWTTQEQRVEWLFPGAETWGNEEMSNGLDLQSRRQIIERPKEQHGS